MDHINSITAERLLFSHTVQMVRYDFQAFFYCEFKLLTVAQVYLRGGLVLQVQTAALDEMFHQGEASIQRYHKALLLMEGLSLLFTDQADILSVSKCE